jgi:hypothetical protein
MSKQDEGGYDCNELSRIFGNQAHAPAEASAIAEQYFLKQSTIAIFMFNPYRVVLAS